MAKSMPLVEAMFKYQQDKVYPFHTPGHKGGRGYEAQLKQAMGEQALAMDVSLMAELDDLHQPSGCLKEAQALAAELYGADQCFFAVNGTTQAVQAMLMSAVKPGEKVLVPRNAHRSVAGGLILGDLEVVFIAPEYNEEFGFNTQVTPRAIAAALAKDKTIKAVLITSPNYYGLAADVAEIARVTHEQGAVLLVDEAHGAHLGFTKLLPPSALSCGADAVAQSTHKLLGAMTQASMLLVQGTRIDLERAAKTMSLLTTTSPNYLLMASLDAARAQLDAAGEEMALHALGVANYLREALSRFSWVTVVDQNIVGQPGVFAFDGTKVTVRVAGCGLTGVEVGAFLREKGIAVELVDYYNTLFLLTYADDYPEIERVIKKIVDAFEELSEIKTPPLPPSGNFALPLAKQVLSVRKAFYKETEIIDFLQARGRIAGEQVSFYPPGIPVLLPGELVSNEIIEYCQKMVALHLPVSGPIDETLKKLRVIKE